MNTTQQPTNVPLPNTIVPDAEGTLRQVNYSTLVDGVVTVHFTPPAPPTPVVFVAIPK